MTYSSPTLAALLEAIIAYQSESIETQEPLIIIMKTEKRSWPITSDLSSTLDDEALD